MLLSLILTFASLNPAVQVQAQTHVAMTADKVVMQLWLAKIHAVEFVRRSNDPHWLKLHGPHRKTHQMIDDMLAKRKPVELLIRKEWAEIKPGTTPYTLVEAMAFAKAIRGAPPDQLNDIWLKFEAQRELSKKKAP